MKTFLSIKNAAKLVGLSNRQFHRKYIESQILRTIKIGRCFFLLTRDVEKLRHA